MKKGKHKGLPTINASLAPTQNSAAGGRRCASCFSVRVLAAAWERAALLLLLLPVKYIRRRRLPTDALTLGLPKARQVEADG